MFEDHRHGVHKALGIVEELVQPASRLQNTDKRRPGELGLILQVGQEIGNGSAPLLYVLFRRAHHGGSDTTFTNAKLPGYDMHAWCLDPLHSLDSFDCT